MATNISTVAFSYADILPQNRDAVRALTASIKERFQRQTSDAIATGRDLIAIKSKMDHGQWLGWLEIEFPMNAKTAQRFMAAAQWAEGKNDIVSNIPVTTVYLLSAKSTPPEIAAEVVAEISAGKKVEHNAIKEMVDDAREAKRKEQSDADRAKEIERKRRRRREQEKQNAEWERKEAERKARQDAATAEIVEMLLPLSFEARATISNALKHTYPQAIREALPTGDYPSHTSTMQVIDKALADKAEAERQRDEFKDKLAEAEKRLKDSTAIVATMKRELQQLQTRDVERRHRQSGVVAVGKRITPERPSPEELANGA